MGDNTNENEQGNESSLPKLAEMVTRLEKANAESKEILKRQEELAARNLLGGETKAGEAKPVKVEESAKDYAARVLSNKVELK